MPVPLLGLHDFQEKVAAQLVPWSRSIQFWARAIDVYAGYKMCQFRTGLISDAAKQEEMWERQHELAAEKMYSLCSELGGLFLKAAQILGKPDLAPAAWVRRLVTLCDKAPATPISTVQQIMEEELGQNFSEIFEQFEVEPIGSASIAQVHRAKLRGVKTDVAVKVQHPGVQQLMLIDIRNVQAFVLFLQKTDINFDLFSVTKEVEKQIAYEFDFLREAVAMERIKNFFSNNNKKPPVLVPRIIPGMVTRKVLAMEFIDGVPIMNLGEQIAKLGIDPSSKIAVLGKQEKETFLLLDWFPFCMALGKILKSLTLAYGQMILKDGYFHADPHPGNILICKGTEVALLDYGQVKQLPDELRLGYANLVLALADNDPLKAKISYKELGIDTFNHADEDDELLKLAQRMFDTKLPPGVTVMSPFAEDSSLKKVSVQSFPEELFSVLRTMQLLRGLSVGMGIFYSCAEQWRPIAEEALFKAGRLEVGDLKDRRRGLLSRIFRRSSTTFTV